MTDLPNLGDRVTVWPAPGLRVQDGDRVGAFLSGPKEVTWDAFWHRRLLEGAVLLRDPAPSPAPAPQTAPATSRRAKE